MKKERFTIDAWLQDLSRKVVDEDGDSIDPRVCSLGWLLERQDRLFIVTPEPTGMSEFGMKASEFAEAYELAATDCESEEYKTCNGNLQLIIDKYAPELFAIAIDANAKELYKGLRQSNLDKDSIPYHLIEFMCNLYTCRNWKEIEETAELYVPRIKAAALKDLPRWRKWENGACGNGRGNPLAIVKRGLNGYALVDALGIQGEQYIMLSDLEKLPGFKED